MIMQGKFISLEGVEGAGKTTLIQSLQQHLESDGIRVLVTREPGGTELSESIRDLLLNPQIQSMHSDTELLLMFAARQEHIEQRIKPALKKGWWVISDRFVDSSFAYQGFGRGLSLSRIQELSDWALGEFHADLTLLLDLSVETGLERVRQRQQRADRFEQEKMDFFQRIREGFLHLQQKAPHRIKRIDAEQNAQMVLSQALHYLNELTANEQ